MKIAIIYTTFLRDELAQRTIPSVITHSLMPSMLFVGNQGKNGSSGSTLCSGTVIRDKIIHHYTLPYDCGLSYARNYLIKEAWKLGYEYCLITADSINFTQPVVLTPVIRFLDARPDTILVGFRLANRPRWEFDLDLIPGQSFRLIMPPDEVIDESGMKFKRVGVCKNFFLAKTELLLKVPWDNDLKLFEHEDWFWRVKQAGYKCYHTDAVSADYILDRPPEYERMRNRMYREFRSILLKKYGIRDWLEYAPEVREKMRMST